MPPFVRVFLNPRSGQNAALSHAAQSKARDLIALFAAQGCRAEITLLTPNADPKSLAASDSPEIAYIAAGGDGTVNAVANAVAGTPRAMGVLPEGTLNHFARDLQLPLELEAAVAVIAQRHTLPIDAAEVNGLLFVNNSSLGAYPAMVLDRERMRKRGRNKWASLVAASFRAFLRFRCLRVEMTVAGLQRTCITPFLFVGNNEYCLEGLQIGRREHLDQGRLALYLAPGASRLSVLRMAFAAIFGRLKETPQYEEILTEEFTVHVRGRRLRVSLDGEVRRMPGPHPQPQDQPEHQPELAEASQARP
jgi:diacylglycerol kinase family enzyme